MSRVSPGCLGTNWCRAGDCVDSGEQIGQPWIRQHPGMFSNCDERLVSAFGIKKNPSSDLGSQRLAYMTADDQQWMEPGDSDIEIGWVNWHDTKPRAQVRKFRGEHVAVGTWLVGNQDVNSG
jgi:hypothetical protein